MRAYKLTIWKRHWNFMKRISAYRKRFAYTTMMAPSGLSTFTYQGIPSSIYSPDQERREDRLEMAHSGITHLAIQVKDIEQAVAMLKHEGFRKNTCLVMPSSKDRRQ